MALDNAAALATGLTPRPFAETVRDTFAWMQTAAWRREGVGVDAGTESRILAAASTDA